jgi:hypothetical protein
MQHNKVYCNWLSGENEDEAAYTACLILNSKAQFLHVGLLRGQTLYKKKKVPFSQLNLKYLLSKIEYFREFTNSEN